MVLRMRRESRRTRIPLGACADAGDCDLIVCADTGCGESDPARGKSAAARAEIGDQHGLNASGLSLGVQSEIAPHPGALAFGVVVRRCRWLAAIERVKERLSGRGGGMLAGDRDGEDTDLVVPGEDERVGSCEIGRAHV